VLIRHLNVEFIKYIKKPPVDFKVPLSIQKQSMSMEVFLTANMQDVIKCPWR